MIQNTWYVCSDEERRLQADTGVVCDAALFLLGGSIFLCSVPGLSFLAQIRHQTLRRWSCDSRWESELGEASVGNASRITWLGGSRDRSMWVDSGEVQKMAGRVGGVQGGV